MVYSVMKPQMSMWCDALLSEDVNQHVTARILGLERRKSGGVPALVHHGPDDLLPDQV